MHTRRRSEHPTGLPALAAGRLVRQLAAASLLRCAAAATASDGVLEID